MGIVYGDIGTSPLYALETALSAAGALRPRGGARRAVADLLGLAISVTLKYVVVIMRADNEGEGGILALFALAQRRLITGSRWAKIAVGLALAGTALVLLRCADHAGDLGARRGRGPGDAQTRTSARCVVPVTLGVIVALFASSAAAPRGSGACSARSWWCGSWCWP